MRMFPLLIMATLVWIVIQCSVASKAKKWHRRFSPAAPVVRYFKADVKATIDYARAWPQRREMTKLLKNIPDELP